MLYIMYFFPCFIIKNINKHTIILYRYRRGDSTRDAKNSCPSVRYRTIRLLPRRWWSHTRYRDTSRMYDNKSQSKALFVFPVFRF